MLCLNLPLWHLGLAASDRTDLYIPEIEDIPRVYSLKYNR